jgi:hypothetical protein
LVYAPALRTAAIRRPAAAGRLSATVDKSAATGRPLDAAARPASARRSAAPIFASIAAAAAAAAAEWYFAAGRFSAGLRCVVVCWSSAVAPFSAAGRSSSGNAVAAICWWKFYCSCWQVFCEVSSC